MRFAQASANVLLCALLATAVTGPVRGQDAPNRVLFTNVNVFDGVNDGLQTGMNVLIEGNLIARISSGSIDASGATVIDGGGRTLMPGLHDQHTHVSTFLPLQTWARDMLHPYAHGAYAVLRAKEILMNGYTTIRDLGGAAHFASDYDPICGRQRLTSDPGFRHGRKECVNDRV